MKRGEGLSRAHTRTERAAHIETRKKVQKRHRGHPRARERPWMNCSKVKARLKELRPFVRIDKYPVIIPRVEPMKKIGFSHDRF